MYENILKLQKNSVNVLKLAQITEKYSVNVL